MATTTAVAEEEATVVVATSTAVVATEVLGEKIPSSDLYKHRGRRGMCIQKFT